MGVQYPRRMVGGGLFEGDPPRTDAEARFLDALGSFAAASPVPGMAGPFDVLAQIAPLVVTLDLPGINVTPAICNLQVGYWESNRFGPSLEGQWGDGYVLDSYDRDGDNLEVTGLDESPETFDGFAARWLERQLLRPVERRDWMRNGDVRYSRWCLSDTGRILARSGALLRLPRNPPSRVVVIR